MAAMPLDTPLQEIPAEERIDDGLCNTVGTYALAGAFAAFTSTVAAGIAGRGMDGRAFVKCLRVAGLIDGSFDSVDADLIFAKCKPLRGRRIDLGGFARAMCLVADRRGERLTDVIGAVVGAVPCAGNMVWPPALPAWALPMQGHSPPHSPPRSPRQQRQGAGSPERRSAPGCAPAATVPGLAAAATAAAHAARPPLSPSYRGGPERFYYDKSTYTGTHKNGGPTVVGNGLERDKYADLKDLVDREHVQDDALRRRKLRRAGSGDLVPAPAVHGGATNNLAAAFAAAVGGIVAAAESRAQTAQPPPRSASEVVLAPVPEEAAQAKMEPVATEPVVSPVRSRSSEGGDREFEQELMSLFWDGKLGLLEACPCDGGKSFGDCHFRSLTTGMCASDAARLPRPVPRLRPLGEASSTSAPAVAPAAAVPASAWLQPMRAATRDAVETAAAAVARLPPQPPTTTPEAPAVPLPTLLGGFRHAPPMDNTKEAKLYGGRGSWKPIRPAGDAATAPDAARAAFDLARRGRVVAWAA